MIDLGSRPDRRRLAIIKKLYDLKYKYGRDNDKSDHA